MFKNIRAIINAWILNKNFKMAVKVANRRVASTGKKQLVFLMNGKFCVVERQRLKEMHRQGSFKKGLNFRQVEKAIVYETT